MERGRRWWQRRKRWVAVQRVRHHFAYAQVATDGVADRHVMESTRIKVTAHGEWPLVGWYLVHAAATLVNTAKVGAKPYLKVGAKACIAPGATVDDDICNI